MSHTQITKASAFEDGRMQGAKDFFFSSEGNRASEGAVNRAMGVPDMPHGNGAGKQARMLLDVMQKGKNNSNERADADLAGLQSKLKDVFTMMQQKNLDIEAKRDEFGLLFNSLATFLTKKSSRGTVSVDKEHLMTLHEVGGAAAVRLDLNLQNTRKQIAVLGNTLHESLVYINNFVAEIKRMTIGKAESEMLDGHLPAILMSCTSMALDSDGTSKRATELGADSVKHMFINVTRKKILELLDECEAFKRCVEHGSFVNDPTLAMRIDEEATKLKNTLELTEEKSSTIDAWDSMLMQSNDGCCPNLLSMLGLNLGVMGTPMGGLSTMGSTMGLGLLP